MPAEPVFVRPTDLADAISHLEDDGAIAYGGGTSVGLLVKNRLVAIDKVVSLASVAQLRGERADDGPLHLGAMTTLRELSRSPLVERFAPSLARAAAVVGNPRVRALATLGGALAHADPRQDLPPVLLALGATARVCGPNGVREIALEDLFVGFMETALYDGELITEVTVPVEPGARTIYTRFTPGSRDDYPTVAVAAVVRLSEFGTVAEARIALGGVGATAVLAPEASDALVGATLDPEHLARAARAAANRVAPTDDQRGSASYKQEMVEVFTRRALEACC